MANSTKTISELVEDVAQYRLVLPEMQRRYVWKSTQVRDLFDSLYRGYPVGSILEWERPSGEDGRNMDVGEDAGRTRDNQSRLLLDGQQRLTSLTAIIKNKDLFVRNRKRPIDILFNVLHPSSSDEETLDSGLEEEDDIEASDLFDEEDATDSLDFSRKTFVVASRKLSNDPKWISLRRVFSESQWTLVNSLATGIAENDPSIDANGIANVIAERINRLQQIANISIPIVTLGPSMDYRTVTDVFCRVNSAGARLRWPGSLHLFEEFQKKYTSNGQQLFDLGFLVRALVVFITGQCKFLTVSSIPAARYPEAWEETKKALEHAFDIARTWGIESFSLISAPSLIITLAYYVSKRPNELSNLSALHRWLMIASVCGHYSKGSSESIMDQDLSAIQKGITIDEMSTAFQKQGWNGQISEHDIRGKFHGSAYFGLMYIMMRKHGAKDWYQDVEINLANVGSQLKVQFHHIFPQARLKAAGDFDASEINDIANLAFIGGNTNKRISAEDPSVYLQKISKENRAAQCVPLNDNLYAISEYRSFLSARRKLLASEMNAYLASL